MDLAELGIKATTTGVKEAGNDLDRLAANSNKAQSAVGGFSKEATGVQRATTLMGSQLGASSLLFSGVGAAALGAVAAISAFVAGALSVKAFVDATVEAEFQQAQLAAALKSTNSASGQTIESLNAQAAAIQNLTNFEDDAVSKSQALLLTFTKIAGDVFPKASMAIVDVATRMGGDLQGATIMVGKALNDPIKGLVGLSRAGIQFSDSQKAVITSMVETNNLAGAQAIILQELSTQFGGSAAAARATLGGAIESLNNAFGNLFEVSGPAVESLRLGLEQLITAMSDPAFKDFANTVGSALFMGLELAVKGIALLVEGVSSFWAYAGPTITEFSRLLWDLGSVVIPAIGNAFKLVWEVVGPVIQYFLEGWRQVYDVTKMVWDLWANPPSVDMPAAPSPPVATDAAAKPIVAAGDDAAKSISAAMDTGAKKTATAITTSNAAGAKTEISTAEQAAKIGAGALANSFGEGASSISEASSDGAGAMAAAIEAQGNIMAAKFEGTGRNIYDLWNNWGDSFIDSFGTSIGSLLIQFQKAQTQQLEAQARLLNAQAALTQEQYKRLANYGEQPGGGSGSGSGGGSGGGESTTGGLNWGDGMNDGNNGRNRRNNRDRVGGRDNTNDPKNKMVRLNERDNIAIKIVNQNDPRDAIDNINTSRGERAILNVISNRRQAVKGMLGARS